LSRSNREKWGIAELRAKQGQILSQDERDALAVTSQAAKDALPAIGRETKLSLAIACRAAAHALSNMNGKQLIQHSSSLKAVAETSDRLFNWTATQNVKSGAINLALFNTDPADLAKLARVTRAAIDVETTTESEVLDSKSSEPSQ
jgi:hypothetical protein